MSKVAVVYWSGTGNTQAMAEAIAEGAKGAGAETLLATPGDFNADMIKDFDAIAFGCPAMGAEELEDSEFLPMYEPCETKLSGKKVALFGSYGWGNGEWMRIWEKQVADKGAFLAADSLIINETPNDDELATCRSFGAGLA